MFQERSQNLKPVRTVGCGAFGTGFPMPACVKIWVPAIVVNGFFEGVVKFTKEVCKT
jgi:hypothetical protein